MIITLFRTTVNESNAVNLDVYTYKLINTYIYKHEMV